MNSIRIGPREVGSRADVLIVAELSANHAHRFEVAAETVRAAASAGADAIKLQTYTADTMTIDAEGPGFLIEGGTLWDGRRLYDLYQEAYTPWEWQPKLARIAEDEGILCFSTPFDRTAVDFLEDMAVPAYKIASFEITDVQLIEYVASKGKPVIMSTGIAELADIEEAVAACRKAGNDQIALLKCTSAYPTPLHEVNLRTLPDLAERFGCVVGLSDHTTSTGVAAAAVALGACIVEKHFIVDRSLGGPDASFSLEPDEFTAMVRAVRDAQAALGEVTYELTEGARSGRAFSRSLFVVADVAAGEVFTEDNIRSIRPAGGLHPRHLEEVLGRRATRAVAKGTPLSRGLVE